MCIVFHGYLVVRGPAYCQTDDVIGLFMDRVESVVLMTSCLRHAPLVGCASGYLLLLWFI